MDRRPNHRGEYGGKDSRQKAYHLHKLFALVAASRDMAAAMLPERTGVYRITPGVVLRWRTSLSDALPYLEDDEGRVKF